MIPNVTIGLDLSDRFSIFHALDDQRMRLEHKSDPHHARSASLPVPESRARSHRPRGRHALTVISRLLSELSHEVIVGNARDLRFIYG